MRIGRTEADEQKAVIQWCILMEKRWPELEALARAGVYLSCPEWRQPKQDRSGKPQRRGREGRCSGSGASGRAGQVHRIAH